jgi:hypothetical protein
MSIAFQCGCGKQLKVRDELAGKRARCPACGEIVPVPVSSDKELPAARMKQTQRLRDRAGDDDESARITRKRPLGALKSTAPSRTDDEESPDSSPPEPDDSDDFGDDEPRRRRKKKKKSTRSAFSTPLVTLFGIDLTPLKLIIVAVVFCVAGVSAFMYLSAPEAKVRVVDVYNLEEDLDEFMTGQAQMDVILNFLFHKEIPKPLILHESSDGTFLLVKFKLSERSLKKLVGERYENFVMKNKDAVLEAGGETFYPLFIYEPDVITPSVTVKAKSLLDDDKEGGGKPAPLREIEAHNKLVAPSEENPWTHEGVLQVNLSGKSTFKGIRGMIVNFDHGPLPTKEMKITWNKNSDFWYGTKEEPVPAEVWLYDWRVACLFPRPASTKGMKLTVLGKPMKMDYP